MFQPLVGDKYRIGGDGQGFRHIVGADGHQRQVRRDGPKYIQPRQYGDVYYQPWGGHVFLMRPGAGAAILWTADRHRLNIAVSVPAG